MADATAGEQLKSLADLAAERRKKKPEATTQPAPPTPPKPQIPEWMKQEGGTKQPEGYETEPIYEGNRIVGYRPKK